MKFRRTALAGMGYELAPNVISSAALETKLAPLYKRLHLQPGQIEALTGIRERRFWDPGFQVSEGALRACRRALENAGVDARDLGALVYGGVCREGFEPATACRVAAGLGMDSRSMILDLSNACLGVLNSCLMVGNMIELGQIKAGLIVSCESAREITEATIERMLASGTMDCLRLSLATMTGGSGAVAMVLVDAESGLGAARHRLLGGVLRSAPEHHKLCYWGPERGPVNGHPPRTIMETDAHEVLKHGVALGEQTWKDLLTELEWTPDDVTKVICHQVGGGHRTAMLGALGVPEERDYSTYEYLGNCGTVALPLTAALAEERAFLESGDNVAFLGIGSGLNCLMLGWEW
jgi:3-oxoacyl-[acyl-carrier-protein] synthase III